MLVPSISSFHSRTHFYPDLLIAQKGCIMQPYNSCYAKQELASLNALIYILPH